MKARDLIKRGLQEIGVLAQGEVASPADEQDALVVLQRRLNAWGAERLTMFQLLRTVKALTSGTRDYTIGSGGSIDIVRPEWIDRASVILDSSATDPIEIPIAIYTEQDWADVRLKTLDAGVIRAIYYDRGFATTATLRGTISTYPTINTANVQLVLYSPVAVAGFVNPTSEYVFPPGYEDAFHYDFAYALQRPFRAPLDPLLTVQRNDAIARIQSANRRPVELRGDAALVGSGGYDIETGGYR